VWTLPGPRAYGDGVAVARRPVCQSLASGPRFVDPPPELTPPGLSDVIPYAAGSTECEESSRTGIAEGPIFSDPVTAWNRPPVAPYTACSGTPAALCSNGHEVHTGIRGADKS
jgi:hypothetical protein